MQNLKTNDEDENISCIWFNFFQQFDVAVTLKKRSATDYY